MNPTRCHHCGRVFQTNRAEGEPVYCCTGCAVRGYIPLDAEGNFPVNAHLLAGVTVVFLYFNQLLIWGTFELLRHQGKVALAPRFAGLGVAIAFLAWGAILALQCWARVSRGKDFVFATVTLSLLLTGSAGSLSLPLLAAANGVFLFWSFRGAFLGPTQGTA